LPAGISINSGEILDDVSPVVLSFDKRSSSLTDVSPMILILKQRGNTVSQTLIVASDFQILSGFGA
jgi:hypothetical protein